MNCKDSRTKVRVLLAGFLLVTAGSFTGCVSRLDDSPTSLIERRVEVVREKYTSEIETEKLNEGALKQIARHYDSNGAGAMEIMISYNPSSQRNSAMIATENASRIGRILSRNGVLDLETQIMPINNSEESISYFSFASYRAQAPAGCKTLFDINDSEHKNYADYELGCSTETYLARQVAKPSDLLGRGGMDDPDGRRLANVIEGRYRDGVPNNALEGEQISGN